MDHRDDHRVDSWPRALGFLLLYLVLWFCLDRPVPIPPGAGSASPTSLTGWTMTLADLYGQYEAGLQAYALRLSRDADQAADLVQETFIRSLAFLPLFDQLNPHQCRAWLCQTLKRLFLDRQAARQREQAALARFAAETASVVVPEEPASGLFELVPANDRELLDKRYRLNLTSRQIAVELGVSAATVRYRLHQAIQRLRARRARPL
jgi:RNA polymerase sigma-70 factor, ECF subfamily